MIEIELKDINNLTSVIKSKYGYDFQDYALSSFKRRLFRVMELQNLQSIETIIDKVKNNELYFKDFLSEITVNVTEMFRDPSFWIALRDQVLLPHFQNHNEIKIWHAGCSSGEEVYSMAILLHKIGKLNNATIHATDIDNKILEKALNKSFSLKNMETNSANYQTIFKDEDINNYFFQKESKLVFKDEYTQNITFKTHNLASDEAFSSFHLILCRNVLIYFNQKLQNIVLKKITSSLPKGGYLCIGSKESLIWCEDTNQYNECNKEEKIFKKIAG